MLPLSGLSTLLTASCSSSPHTHCRHTSVNFCALCGFQCNDVLYKVCFVTWNKLNRHRLQNGLHCGAHCRVSCRLHLYCIYKTMFSIPILAVFVCFCICIKDVSLYCSVCALVWAQSPHCAACLLTHSTSATISHCSTVFGCAVFVFYDTFSVLELYNEILLTASEYAKLFTDRHWYIPTLAQP